MLIEARADGADGRAELHQAIKIADRGYIIVGGQIAFEGADTRALNENEMVKRYYLSA